MVQTLHLEAAHLRVVLIDCFSSYMLACHNHAVRKSQMKNESRQTKAVLETSLNGQKLRCIELLSSTDAYL